MIEPKPEGYTFVRTRASWPLHITLMPWFYVDPDVQQEFRESLTEFLHTAHQIFQVEVGQRAQFGPQHDVSVNVVATQAEIRALHDGLLAFVQSHGGELSTYSQTWTGDDYRAHITLHDGVGAEEGAVLSVGKVTLVSLQDNNLCKVETVFDLGDLA